MTDQQPPTDRPLTMAEAARLLGVSREAVRLRVRRGTLRGEKRRKGWVVWLGETTVPTDQGPTSDRPEATDHDLQAEIQWLRERLEQAETERAELRRMLLFEQQTVASLRAQLPPASTDRPPTDQAYNAPPARQDAILRASPSFRDVLAVVRRWLRNPTR